MAPIGRVGEAAAIHLTHPLFLLLLALLPLVAVIGWPGPGRGRARDTMALGLRVALMSGLILSLAGLELERSSQDLAVVFLLDHSDSMSPDARDEAFGYVREAMQAMGPEDQAAVVVFGREALVEQAMGHRHELPPISSSPDPSQTDLGAAIRLGLALYPPDGARRMVVLSDGQETQGDAAQAARLAAALQVELLLVPFGAAPMPEVWLAGVEAPGHLREAERFDLSLAVQSTQATEAVLRVWADAALVYNQVQPLSAGLQRLQIPLIAGAPGFVRYRVQLESAADNHYQNNELGAFTQVLGPPRLLLVAPQVGEPIGLSGEPRPDEAAQLEAALRASGFLVERVLPHQLPLGDLSGLAGYNAVVLVDVPARQLSQRQMNQLQSYVRDLGGGLLAVGGPTSFGVGGYFRTPLEEILPVDMQITDQLRRPTLAMAFVIDRSGSMGEVSGGTAKIELAKEAAVRSAELLFPGDRVGVVAFDETASWVVPISEAGDLQTIADGIGSLAAGGGTDILAGLQAVARILPADPAAVKHIILLTDGGADPTGILELVTRLRSESGITLSAVGIGSDAAPFLADLAAQGGGRYHFAPDPESLPTIFTEETALVARSYLVEQPFYPEQVGGHPLLSGLTELPPLHGYVATRAKDLARVLLVSPEADPILAVWQYGLGQAAAFTSDATGRWGRDWVSWTGFGAFWSGLARAVTARQEATPLQVSIQSGGYVEVEARAPSGDSLNGLQLGGSALGPAGMRQALAFQQVGPGRYRAPFDPREHGVYLIRVAQASGAAAASTTVGWVMPYSPEYGRPPSEQGEHWRGLQAEGGRLVQAEPQQAFAHTLIGRASALPVRPWLLKAAAVLLVLDIGIRRLVVGREDLRRAWRALAARLRRIRPVAEPMAPRPVRLRRLFEAKQRARPPGERMDRTPKEASAGMPMRPGMKGPPQMGERPGMGVPPQMEERPGMEGPPEAGAADSAGATAPAPTSPQQDRPAPGGLAARLLARKRGKRSLEDDSSGG